MNYDKMLARNRKANTEKALNAEQEIRRMVAHNEPVTVTELIKRTGLSKGFFYRNERVRRALENAREMQGWEPRPYPQKAILDKAMDRQIQVMQRQIKKLQDENSSLTKANENLQKALNKRNLNFIKNL